MASLSALRWLAGLNAEAAQRPAASWIGTSTTKVSLSAVKCWAMRFVGPRAREARRLQS